MANISITGSRIIDLSQTIEPGIPLPVGFPSPEIDFFVSQSKGDVINVEKVAMGMHCATHMDAPYHFFKDLQTVDQVPPDCLIGPAVVVDLTNKIGCVPIEAEDIQNWEDKTGIKINAGDGVLLRTDHSKKWKLGDAGDDFWKHGWPYLTRSAVDYLVEKQIRMIGVESMDLDHVDPFDLSKAEFPAHRTFLPKGIYIVENLTNLDLIPGSRCQLIAVPLKFKGASGSPVRVLAVI